ncbi:Serine/threonine-protein phosphatase 1 [Methylobacterium symbioticum]|uniref:Serine/threonine-protein phosphatase 1 n=2 Tax=Methylobacterium symbioticum TaxID=2584084 RepID=A0A509EIR4_9HYPH|nr:Serine/threonine-protein phosphatase 1 [Methylobacterium symbioticum]
MAGMCAEPLTYAVGDIHGCADQLDRLLEGIETHAAGRPRRLVFLGDYIDRGPASARVIETLRKLHWREPDSVVCLMGNHEAMLLESLRTPGADAHWMVNGGLATLDSFGVEEPAALPSDVLDWIEALPTLHADARRWYVHAGFHPASPAPDPDARNRLWIREPFLTEDRDFGRHVVHGHTPQGGGRPEVRAYRTNLDTGAVYGGPLTAGVFTDRAAAAETFLQVRFG